MRRKLALGLLLALGASADEVRAKKAPLETISYERHISALCFACVQLRIVASSDGAVLITQHYVGPGHRGQADPAPRKEHITSARFAEFSHTLDDLLPPGADQRLRAQISTYVTDQDTLSVTWGGSARSDHEEVYLGWDPGKNGELFKALSRAPDLLRLGPIGGLPLSAIH